MKYRNVGAPIPRDDGTFIQSGEVFEPTASELKTCKHKLVEFEAKDWPLAMAPEQYLRVSPDGDLAELARRLAPPTEPEE